MKKLITLLMVLLLIAGCSGKKDTESKPESSYTPTLKQAETDPYEKYYGTWRTSSVEVNGSRFDMDQIEALGEKETVDALFIFNKNGTLLGYKFSDQNLNSFSWSKNEENKTAISDDLEFIINDNNELVLPLSDGSIVYMEKISSKQDSSVIDELIAAEPKQEESKQEEVIEKETISEDTIRPEVKEAIDSYESFIDEYCEFMEKYAKSGGTDLSLLVDYAKFVSSLSDYEEKMDAMEDDLTDAEYWYYYEVLTRCNEKLLKAAY